MTVYSTSVSLLTSALQMKDAAVYYQKSQCYKEASECYELIEEFDLAIKMYCQEELYEEAAKAVERYVLQDGLGI